MAKIKVAIIEDSAIIRTRLIELVNEIANIEVVGVAANEKSAVDLCKKTNPDVIMLDIQLEVGTGLGVLRTMAYGVDKATMPSLAGKIGAEVASARPMIIVLTNFPSPSIERAAMALGATIFLDKSIEFHKISALLQSVANTV